VWLTEDPGYVVTQSSPDLLWVEECPFYIYQKWDISCCSSQCIPVNKETTLDRLTANRGTVAIPWSYTQCRYTQLDSAWIEGAHWLSLVPFWLVANYIIFRTSHFFSWSSSSLFHNSKSWLQKHFTQVRLDLRCVDAQEAWAGTEGIDGATRCG